MISEMELNKLNETMGTVFLDPDQKSPRAQDFEERLSARIVRTGARRAAHERPLPDISRRHEPA